VEGESMKNAGILSGDLLVVDRSLNAKHNSIIVAMLDGEFIVKRLLIRGQKYTLYSDNPAYHDIDISIDHDFEVWGVVTYAIHKTI
jgi:DNA polymerase V